MEHQVRNKLPIKKKILFAFLTAFLMYIVIEFISFAFLEILNIKSTTVGYPNKLWIYDEKLDYKCRPNFRGTFSTSNYSSIPIEINSQGFRDYEFELKKKPGIYRILLLGDSITFGPGVQVEDTYAKQTEKLLKDSFDHNIEIINASVSGYHFDHYYIFIKENLDSFQADQLIIGLCINDVRPKEVVRTRYIVRPGKEVISYINLKHQLKQLIKASPTFQLSSYLVFSNSYMRQKYSAMWITEVMLSWNDKELVNKFSGMLREVKEMTDERGIKLSLVIFPEMHQFINYEKYGAPREKILAILDKMKINYFDLFETFEDKSDISRYYLPGDTVHFTAEGNRVIAEKISNFVLSISN